MKSRLRRWLARAVSVLGVAYPALLAVAWLLLRFVGERWWVTDVVLFLPPWGFALPLPFVVVALLVSRKKRLLALQSLSLILLLFPLMGLCIGWPSTPRNGAPRLRILSYNTDSAKGGAELLTQQILGQSADVVFLQELPNSADLRPRLAAKYPHIDAQGEFLVASKYPIVQAQVPARLPFYGMLRSPRFMRVVIATPLGNVTFFHVHTVSPRGGFYQLRGLGFRREIASGRLLLGEHADSVQALAELRTLQISSMARMASAEKGPVVIVGDTNSPTLSPTRHENLARFRDGFAEAGIGFGYTFPAKFPWMRIDVMLATHDLVFTHFEVGTGKVSDHRFILSELCSDAG